MKKKNHITCSWLYWWPFNLS